MGERLNFFREGLIGYGMRQFLRIGRLSTQGQEYFEKVVLPAMIKGERRWPSQDADKLLSGFQIEVHGEELIPEKGLGLVVLNHCDSGPLKHWWSGYWVSFLTEKKTGKDTRWLIQDSLEVGLGRLKFGVEVPLFSEMQRLFVETYQLFSVPAGFKGKSGFSAMAHLRREFAKGEVLGLLPEMKASVDLASGNPVAGRLVKALAKVRPGALVLPVRASSKKKELCLSIGYPKQINELVSADNQETADRLMLEIGRLKSIG